MPEPTSWRVTEALLVASTIAALPYGLVSGLEAGFTFLVIAFVLGWMVGGPVFWLLWWCKAANAFTCALGGMLASAAFVAFIGIPGAMRGRKQELVTEFALWGAALGVIFWFYLARRMRNDQGWRRARTTEELLAWAREQARPDIEARHAKDVEIRVAADPGASNAYALSVTNTGPHAFRALEVDDRELLMWAENFGLDTTHMPDAQQYCACEPVVIDFLRPGEKVRLVRHGYGEHGRYDGARERTVHVAYVLRGRKVTRADRHWARVVVDLPHARRS
jgi:hypothetical protein